MSGNIKTVDARGLSCPQPVLEVKRAVEKSGCGTIDVLVDTATSRENVLRFARNAGWQADFEQVSDHFKIRLRK